jgi:hypothetical protein
VGAIEASKEIGLSAEEAASAAATGAVEAADKIGGKTASAVRKAVTGTIEGIKVILKEPFMKEKQPRQGAIRKPGEEG